MIIYVHLKKKFVLDHNFYLYESFKMNKFVECSSTRGTIASGQVSKLYEYMQNSYN